MLREKQENRVVCRREWTDGIPPLPLLTPLDVLRFSVSVRGPASQRSLSPSGHRAVPLFLSLTHTHTHTRALTLSLSLSPGPWRFSRESGRGAASRAREMPVIRRDFNYAHYESFSPRETRGTVLDARSSALRDKGGPASRRSAPRVRSDALFYEHDRPLPLLLYSRHAVTLACTTSAATIAVPLFFPSLFSRSPLFLCRYWYYRRLEFLHYVSSLLPTVASRLFLFLFVFAPPGDKRDVSPRKTRKFSACAFRGRYDGTSS